MPVILAVIQFITFYLLVCRIKMKIYKTVILPVVLYECEAWSLTLREEGVWEQGAEQSMWTQEGYKVIEGWIKLHKEELHNLYSSPNIIRIIKSRRMRWAWQMHVGFLWQSQKEGDHQKVVDVDVGWSVILKWILGKQDGVVRAGFIWLRRALVNTVMTFRVKMLGNS
jgi:hypothetical protein